MINTTESAIFMTLRKLNVRFYPPGMFMEVLDGGEYIQKEVELPVLTPVTDIPALAVNLMQHYHEFLPIHETNLRNALKQLRDSQLVEFNEYKLVKSHKPHVMPIINCCYNKGGDLFMTTSNDRIAKVIESDSGRVIAQFKGHSNSVYWSCFNLPTGNIAATASFDRTARIWSIVDSSCIHILTGHTKEVTYVKFDPTSQFLATGSSDYSCRLWDVMEGTCLAVLDEHTEDVCTVDFHPFEPSLVTASSDSTAKVWDIRSAECTSTLRAHQSELCGAYYSILGDIIITGSYDGTARIWDLRNPDPTPRRAFKGHTDAIVSIALSTDGKMAATGSTDKTAKIWNTETGDLILTCEGHTDEVNSVAFSPQGTRLLTGSDDFSCVLWDIDDGEKVQKLLGHRDIVLNCAFNYDGSRIMTTSKDNTIRQYKAAGTRIRNAALVDT